MVQVMVAEVVVIGLMATAEITGAPDAVVVNVNVVDVVTVPAELAERTA